MNWADYAILSIIAISAFISVMRGFVREALSLLGWILAFWVAMTFIEEFAWLLAGTILTPSLRLGVAFFALFLATLLLTILVNYLVCQLMEKTGLSATDRVLGIVFGITRGAFVVGILILFAGLTVLPREPWWRESLLIGYFEVLAREIRGLLPTDLAVYLNYANVSPTEVVVAGYCVANVDNQCVE